MTKHKKFLILIFLFLFISALFAQKTIRPVGKHPSELPEVVYRKGKALLIGINEYPNLPANCQLDYAVADAEDFARLLKNKFRFTDIEILRDRKATKQGILNALSSFADTNRVKSNDCVLVYFSGHGQTIELPRSRGGGEMGFLVPYDARVDLSGKPNAAEYYRYCIGMDELKRVARLISAKHIIFIVDSCYSGLALKSSKGLSPEVPGYLRKVARASTQQMITAGGKGEEVPEDPVYGHGVFTYKLLEGLEKEIADWNDDGVITGSELGTYLRTVVPQIAKQNPDFRREGEGEFLFLPQEVDEPPITISEEEVPSDDDSSVVIIESTATLFVDSTPKSATVKVDSKKVGTTPCTVKIDTGISGKRELTISVSKAGYLSKEVTTELIGGRRFEWKDVELVKLTATLIVDSEPRGATVYVDDERKGTTRCSIELNVDPNGGREAIVAVSKDGYLTQRANVKLIAGKTARWTDIKLEPSTSPAPTPISGKKEIVWEKDGAEMVLIPAGEFEMGDHHGVGGDDEKPVHTVYTDAFYMDKYEVTIGRYKKFINATGHSAPDWSKVSKYSPTDEHPIVYVSRHDAQVYAKWAGKRLPTEAEWEKAARGGLVGKKYPWGDEEPGAGGKYRANYDLGDDEADGDDADGYRYCAPVGSFSPNSYGLYDMAGNVSEWCSDWYNENYYSSSPRENPLGPASGKYYRVFRGGSWTTNSIGIRTANRPYGVPTYSGGLNGFRCVVSQDLTPSSYGRVGPTTSGRVATGSSLEHSDKVQKGSGLFEISSEVRGRRVTYWPEVPEVQEREVGVVVLTFWVNPEGEVSNVIIKRKPGDPLLEKKAKQFVEQIRFARLPRSIEQKPQKGEITIDFTKNLKRNE